MQGRQKSGDEIQDAAAAFAGEDVAFFVQGPERCGYLGKTPQTKVSRDRDDGTFVSLGDPFVAIEQLRLDSLSEVLARVLEFLQAVQFKTHVL